MKESRETEADGDYLHGMVPATCVEGEWDGTASICTWTRGQAVLEKCIGNSRFAAKLMKVQSVALKSHFRL